MPKLAPGDRAPKFVLEDQHGNTVKLADFTGRKLLLYFYPKADTPGCTTQSCAVRDARAGLGRRRVAVVGISPDTPNRQRKFDDKYELGFPLLADEDLFLITSAGVLLFENDGHGRFRRARARFEVSPEEAGSMTMCGASPLGVRTSSARIPES